MIEGGVVLGGSVCCTTDNAGAGAGAAGAGGLG